MASKSPLSSFFMRVSRLPRSCSISKSGRKLSIWACLLKLDVPILAPFGRSRSLTLFLLNTASRGSSLSVIQRRCSPSGKKVGTSFMEWTARWALPSRSASSISFTKSPLPPTLASGTSRILSPVVFILLSVTSSSGCLFSISLFTQFACQSASWLPLVPMIIVFFKISPLIFCSERHNFACLRCSDVLF